MADYNCFSPQKLRSNGQRRRKCELTFYIDEEEEQEKEKGRSHRERGFLINSVKYLD
jgi:hypothetical protein